MQLSSQMVGIRSKHTDGHSLPKATFISAVFIPEKVKQMEQEKKMKAQQVSSSLSAFQAPVMVVRLSLSYPAKSTSPKGMRETDRLFVREKSLRVHHHHCLSLSLSACVNKLFSPVSIVTFARSLNIHMIFVMREFSTEWKLPNSISCFLTI